MCDEGMVNHSFRAAVVDVRSRPISGVLQFVSYLNEIDVSIAEIAGQYKASLHSSELFRLGFATDEHSEKFRDAGLDKAVYKWRPQPLSRNGVRLSFQVLIPAIGLGSNCGYQVGPDVYQLKEPEGDDVLIVSLLETSTPGVSNSMLHDGVEVIHEWSTIGGRNVSITAQIYSPTSQELQQWRTLISSSELYSKFTVKSQEIEGEYNPRGIWNLDAPDGCCRIFEAGMRELAMWATFSNS